jgi:hypothetical protein
MNSILLAILLFLIQAPQTQPGSIQGVIVRVGTSTPVAGARVNLGTAQTLTDDSGRFSFREVPPGRYRVGAMHTDYMPAESAQRKGVAGVDVTLAPGQTVSDLVLTMLPKAGVSGRIFDNNRNAVAAASVQALKYSYQDGRRILISVRSAASSNSGDYVLPSLDPGQYVIRAVPQSTNAGETPLPVYYPGTTVASLASAIELPPGLNVNGLDLTLSDARPVRIRGRIVSGGEPVFAVSLTLVPRRGTVSTGSLQRTSVANDGAFEFQRIASGAYDVVASGTIPDGTRLAGSTPVEIGNSDIDDVTVNLQAQVSISGKVSIENEQAGLANLTGLRIQLRREPFIPELLIIIPNVAPDGTFTMAGVTPGEYQLKVTANGFQGYVKSARLGAINALNPPFQIDAKAELDIVLSRNAGSLDSLVTDDARKPFPEATVVLVPEPPERQRFDLYYAVGSNESGVARFRSVAPGDYRLFAWDDVPADAWQDADFLRPYEHLGKSVHVSEGSNQRLDVTVIHWR